MVVDMTLSNKVQSDLSRHEADHPSSPVAHFASHEPLLLDCGFELAPWQIAYQTYGTLNADRSNAILICHALTGDSHVSGPAGPGHVTAGWWDGLVGPGAPIETDRSNNCSRSRISRFFMAAAQAVGWPEYVNPVRSR